LYFNKIINKLLCLHRPNQKSIVSTPLNLVPYTNPTHLFCLITSRKFRTFHNFYSISVRLHSGRGRELSRKRPRVSPSRCIRTSPTSLTSSSPHRADHTTGKRAPSNGPIPSRSTHHIAVFTAEPKAGRRKAPATTRNTPEETLTWFAWDASLALAHSLSLSLFRRTVTPAGHQLRCSARASAIRFGISVDRVRPTAGDRRRRTSTRPPRPVQTVRARLRSIVHHILLRPWVSL